MRAPYDAFYGQPPAALTKFCAYNKKHTFYMSEAGSQFAKVQMSFVMLRGYELRWHTQFDWVIRLRTDMFFLAPLPHYASLSTGAHVPLGMVLPGFINGHSIIVSPTACSGLFRARVRLGVQLERRAARGTPSPAGLQRHHVRDLRAAAGPSGARVGH